MRYGVYKKRYSEFQTYRYSLVDEEDCVLCIAEPTGLFLPDPTRRISFFDDKHLPLGRLEPPPSPWPMGGTYTLLLKGREGAPVSIEEQWNLVDLILLRLPRYVFHLDGATYAAHGHRYGERLYQIFALPPAEETEMAETAEPPPTDEELWPTLSYETPVLPPPGEPVGEILRSVRGPSYAIEVTSPTLTYVPPLLIALVVLIDLHLQTHPA